MGISARRFDGWEPRETTTVTGFDGQGRPAGWVTVREPEWNRRERSLMLALALWEGQLCRRCGEHLSHATDPMTDPDRPEAPQAWIANEPDECFSCKALVGAEHRWAKQDSEGEPPQSGWLIHTTSLVGKKPRLRRR